MKIHLTLKTFLVFLIVSILLGNAKLLAQPVNDLIENAIDLGEGPIPYLDVDIDLASATHLNDQTPGPLCEAVDPGVWYKFKATSVGTATAEILTPNDPFVIFFSGPENATNGQQLFFVNQPTNICNIGSSSSIETTIGVTYYIYISNNELSDATINVGETFAPPANDLIENATNLNGLEDYSDVDVHFLMATSTGDGGQNGCNSGLAIWYKFTAQIDGQVIAGVGTPPAQSVILFYSAANENATSGEDLTHIDQPTNSCEFGNLSSINATAGVTYYILAATSQAYIDVSVNLSGVLSTEDNVINGFSFYPNPVTSEINLSAKTAIDEVILYNLLGQRVVAERPNTSAKKIDLSFLETGLYVMHISSEGKTASYKILKK